MTPERDAGLAKALKHALPSPSPMYGTKARVRRAIDESVRVSRRRFSYVTITLAAVLFSMVGTAAGLRLGKRSAEPLRDSTLVLQTARILLRPDARLEVAHDDSGGTLVKLTSGTILVHVQRGSGRPFEVEAGTIRVHVVGTVFAVSRRDSGAAVEVEEGVVRIEDGTRIKSLHAGSRWPDGVRLFEDPSELDVVRAPVTISKTAPTTAPTKTSASPAPTDAGISTPPRAQTKRAMSRATTAVTMTMPEDLYARARALEERGDRSAALSAYRSLSERGGPMAEDALFAIARLETERADLSEALAAIERYRALFPNGRYARDVDVRELNRRLGAGDEVGALRSCDTFLAHYPSDPRAWRFRLARAQYHARHGDCAGARKDLESVPQNDARASVLSECPR